MKKNTIMKGVLLLIVLAVLTLGFGGCGATIIIPTTGTVYVTVDSWDYYYIYMDGSYKGSSYYSSSYVPIYNVPVGYHTFEASGYWYYGSKYQYISSGINYVTIYTY